MNGREVGGVRALSQGYPAARSVKDGQREEEAGRCRGLSQTSCFPGEQGAAKQLWPTLVRQTSQMQGWPGLEYVKHAVKLDVKFCVVDRSKRGARAAPA